MSATIFPSPEWPLIPVRDEAAAYPVHRVFCVGRNYAAHAREMGLEVDRNAPFYFTKSALAILPSGQSFPYPPGTENFHYEMEFVIAIGKPVFRIPVNEAAEAIYGYACGLDMTRRDLQLAAREKGRPWDLAKDGEGSAVIGPITKAEDFGEPGGQRIQLTVDGELRQDARLSDMIWSVSELIADLSKFYHLAPGDLIYTGTPAGVGAIQPGAVLQGMIEGLDPVDLIIGDPE